MANRLDKLNAMAGAMPKANAVVAPAQQAKQAMGVQAALQAAPVGPGGAGALRQAQQLAATSVAQQGQQAVQGMQANQQRVAGLAQEVLKEQAFGGQQELAGLERAGAATVEEGAARLAELDRNLKQEVFDSRLRFVNDENGRLFLNQRQLLDLAKVEAESEEEFKQWAQEMQHVADTDLEVMRVAYGRISQALAAAQARAENAKDHEQIKRLTEAKVEAEKAMRRKEAKAKNNMMIASTLGGVAAAGGVLLATGGTGAAYAPAAYSVGSGATSAAYATSQR